MSRTPEETARLAAEIERISADLYLEREEVARWREVASIGAREAAGLRAEVAALREVAGLVREWQAARRWASTVHGETWDSASDDVRVAARNGLFAIESRLLAATLPEVSRG